MKLPANHVMQHNGESLNWCVGDAVSPDLEPANKRNPKIFWCWGVVKGWNTCNAKYCGKFNQLTREVTEIKSINK